MFQVDVRQRQVWRHLGKLRRIGESARSWLTSDKALEQAKALQESSGIGMA